MAERIPTMPQEMPERIPTMPQNDIGHIPTMPQTDSGHIPTMPQDGGGHIPTMPQDGSGHIPTMPQDGGGHIPTMPQQSADGHVPTVPQQGGAPAAVSANSRRLLVSGNVSFTGDLGGSFTVHGADVISNDSGESQIFGCEKAGSREKMIARILTTVTPKDDIEKRRQRDKVLDFLDRVSRKKDSHILPLIDHGTVELDGTEYFVEVYPFCEGGDLGRRSGAIHYDELCEKIIPAVNDALREFHRAGFVHRDVKPDNLYYYQGRVVLGDFGITCDLREDGFATDRYKTGTLGYYAPELMSQAAITASDYYSFGQTIWTLYSGEIMYGNILRIYKSYGIEEQRNQVNFAMMQNTYYGLDEIPEDQAFFEVLIRGLLQYDPSTRFDYEKVSRWLMGDRSLRNEVKGIEGGETTFSKPFRLLGGECWDLQEFAQKLSENWEKAKQYLYDGTLRDFIAGENFELATYLKELTRTYIEPPPEDDLVITISNENHIETTGFERKRAELREYWGDLGLSKLLMHLEHNRRLCWCGMAITTLRDLGQLDFENNTKNADGLILSGVLLEWYPLQKNCSEDTLTALKHLHLMYRSDRFTKFAAIAWCMAFRAFGGHLLFNNMADLNEVAEKQLSSASEFYCIGRDGQPFPDDIPLLGALCMWGYYEAVEMICKNHDAPLTDRFEQIFDFLEQNTEGEMRAKVRRAYCAFGPKAHYNWFQQHLPEVYQVKGPQCKAMTARIAECGADGTLPIAEQREVLGKLEPLAAQLLGYREDDIFMAQLGLSQVLPDESLSTTELRGMWAYSFLGQLAPIGFKQEQGL